MEHGAIDIVANLWGPEEVSAKHLGVDEVFLEKVRFPRELWGGVPVEGMLERMDRAGIERALVPATRAGDVRLKYSFAIPYERVASVVEQHPDRFSGLAGVDPTRIHQGVKELERGITEFGFVGAHLYPHWFEKAPDDKVYYPFYEKCCELDVPIMMQVGHCLDYNRDRVLPSVGRPITLDRVAIDFPELKLIGIHLGWPWTEEMIALAYKHEKVYMCGDAYGPRHWPKEYIHFINSWGQDKVMFGTDWPVVDFERAMAEIEEFDLRPEPKRKFLRDNAMELFKLPARTKATVG
jgi:predicted TIM-barrel fold metal-dependent hydrolase